MTAFRIWTEQPLADGFFGKDQELDEPGFGTSGKNISPAIRWEGVPPGAQSLALTVYDPDAPTGSGFWHWIVVNLPVSTTSLPENAGRAAGDLVPAGSLQLKNDYGSTGFGGFAPPKGDKPHRYIFTVHALSVPSLPLNSDATNAVGRFMIHLNQIASAEVAGLYRIA